MIVQFVDTNVLLYAISTDPTERAKAERANVILRGRRLGLSVQVLQEFYVQATRPTRADRLSARQAGDLVTSFTRFAVQDTTVGLVQAAIAALHARGAVRLQRVRFRRNRSRMASLSADHISKSYKTP